MKLRKLLKKNKTLYLYKKNKTQDNFIELKKLRAKTKFLIKKSKQISWNNYTSSINSQTKTSQIWNKIRSLKGLNRNNEIIIKNNNEIVTEQEEVAKLLGQYFYENFSDNIYDSKFLLGVKAQTEKNPITSNINPNNLDQVILNSPITIEEMNQNLNKCKSKSPGPDEIPFIFLQYLGQKSKKNLLNIYNSIWNSGNIPGEWKKGFIIPILKPGNDKNSTNGYRPITLLNTMAKLLEKIVNNRLIWFIEKSKILSSRQSGFRKHRSTLDNLFIINSEIQKALSTKQYLSMISLDISKAYDSAWRHRILMILSKVISNGNLLNYLKNFLSSRKFMVKISKTLSNTFIQENGVP